MRDDASLRETETVVQSLATETVPCHLVITRNAHTEILLTRHDSNVSLPRVEIPMWERPAPYLNSLARELWGVQTVCLFKSHGEGAEADPLKERYYVLEAIEVDPMLNGGAAWLSAGKIDSMGPGSIAGHSRLEKAMSQARAHDRGELAGAFARTGWLEELTSWVQSHLSSRGWRLTGDWAQYNMGPCFCLLRLATSGPSVWFKAVGEPNLREYAVTDALRKLHSSYLPEVLATDSRRHGWLAVSVSGHHLDEIWDLSHWKNAASSLARLQVESLEKIEALLAAGCKDLRLKRLDSVVDALFDLIAELMKRQPSSPPRILTGDELLFVRDSLHRACDRLQSLGFSETLGHNDLNPGNVIVDDERAIFVDWAEANVSHPFFAFEYLASVLCRLRPDLEDWLAHLKEAYSRPWRDLCSGEQIEAAFRLTPLVAVLAFAAGCSGWQNIGREMTPNRAKLMRSLARRMHAEACRLDDKSSRFSCSQ
jgi:hypothetical protein